MKRVKWSRTEAPASMQIANMIEVLDENFCRLLLDAENNILYKCLQGITDNTFDTWYTGTLNVDEI